MDFTDAPLYLFGANFGEVARERLEAAVDSRIFRSATLRNSTPGGRWGSNRTSNRGSSRGGSDLPGQEKWEGYSNLQSSVASPTTLQGTTEETQLSNNWERLPGSIRQIHKSSPDRK